MGRHPASESLCWPTGPHLHTDLQQITGVPSCFKYSTIILVPMKHSISGLNRNSIEIIWEAGVDPPVGHCRPPEVCLLSKQVCRWCCQHGAAPCPPTPLVPTAHTTLNSSLFGVQTFRFLGSTVSQDLKSPFNIIHYQKGSAEDVWASSRIYNWDCFDYRTIF